MKKRLAALGFTSFFSACAIACSSASAPYVSPEAGAFPAEPLQTGMTAGGTLQFEMRTLPQPPARGTNAAEFVFTDPADGSPVDGLTLQVTPWMPAMNHGDGIYPSITAAGNGRYVVGNLDFFMPGEWELQTTVSSDVDASAVTDNVTPTFDVP